MSEQRDKKDLIEEISKKTAAAVGRLIQSVATLPICHDFAKEIFYNDSHVSPILFINLISMQFKPLTSVIHNTRIIYFWQLLVRI